QLSYVIRDEALVITTPEKAKGKLVQKTYSVADLVIPVSGMTTGCGGCNTSKACVTGLTPAGTFNHDWNIPVTADGTGPAVFTCRTECPPKTTEESLIQTIIHTVSPQSWSAVGGAGTIDYFPLGYALVINQTPD